MRLGLAGKQYLTELIVPPEGTVCRSAHLPFDPDFGQ
jgi:hypothetical protein